MINFRASSTASVDGGLFIDVPVPTGVQTGDFMIAHLTYRQGKASTVTTPAGWTLLRSDDSYPDSGGVTGYIFTKIASGSEPANYTFVTQDYRAVCAGIIAYSGVKNALPIDVTSAAAVGDAGTTTPTSPSITTIYTAPRLIWFLAARDTTSSDTATPPGGMTQRWRVNVDTPGCLSLVADQVFSGPGASGAKAGTVSPSVHTVAQMLFLSPADESPDHPPTANAGSDRATEVGVGIILDGSASSDVDPGDVLTYAWTHISGPNTTAQLSDVTAVSPTYTPINAGIDTFRLTVTDSAAVSDTDDVIVSTTPVGVNLSFASGVGNTMTVPLPSGAQAGDVAFLATCTRPMVMKPTVPNWSAIIEATRGSSSTDISMFTFAKRLSAGDLGGSVTATVDDLFGSQWTAHVVTVRGLHTSSLYNNQIATVPLTSPGSFSNSVVGGAGSATYTYTVTSIDAAGETIATQQQTVSSAPSTLTGSNYVKLHWQPVSRATGYNIYGRTVGSQQLIATVTTPQTEVPDELYYIYHDTGTTPSGQTPPTQQPLDWLLDGQSTFGDSTPAPERLYTTYASGKLLMFAAAQLDVANAAVSVSDPSGVSIITTTTSPNGKMALHSCMHLLGAAGDIGTRLFTPTDYAAAWSTIGITLRPSSANGTPTARAGFDQYAERGATVYLDASQSYDDDEDILTYLWAQTAGPTVTLSNNTAAFPSFTMPKSNVTFQLTATDPSNAQSTDSVTIRVVRAGPKVKQSNGTWATAN